MRQWMFLMVAICGVMSTSGASAGSVWGKAEIGEKTLASSYAPQMLACGKMAAKHVSDGATQSSSRPAVSKPAKSRASAALLTRR